MFLLLPYQHDRMGVRRLPLVSIALILVNVAAFALTHGAALANRERVEESLAAVYDYWASNPFVKTTPAFEEHFAKPVSSLRKLIGKSFDAPPAEALAAQQAEFEALMGRALAVAREGPYAAWGFTPAEPSPPGLLTHQFMHAGWLHLLANLLFLYLSAPFVEDLWGRVLFGAFYLAGGAAAAGAHALAYPSSGLPLVGASGAIAAVMGAFLVTLATTRIRFLWAFMVIGVRWGTFDAPAWIMLPFWLLYQVLQANVAGDSTGVAFWAHIGGFGFGAAFAAALRFSGLEARFFGRRVAEAASSYGDPRIDRARALLDGGGPAEAREALAEVVRERPAQPDARNVLYEAGLAEARPEEAARHVAPMLEGYLRAGNVAMALERYEDARGKLPELVLPARVLLTLGERQEKAGSAAAALGLYARLAEAHPRDVLSLKGLLRAARLAGTPGQARELIARARSHPAAARGEWRKMVEEAAAKLGTPGSATEK